MRRIQQWRDAQSLYMPEVLKLTETETDSDHLRPESISLYMPSGVPMDLISSASLVEKERRLRQAQAEDALVELRRLLRVRFGLRNFKFMQVGHSQKANTRMRTLLTRFQERISRCADRYRVAQSALLRLDPDGSWTDHLLELKAEHIRGPGRESEDESEGRRELSWIWMVKDGANEDAAESEVDKSELGPVWGTTITEEAW
jgi:hypothetical protein